MSTQMILAVVAAFSLGPACSVWGCGGCPPTGPKRGCMETMKAAVWLCLFNGCAWGVVLLSAGLSGP